jgi:hypothetical protein
MFFSMEPRIRKVLFLVILNLALKFIMAKFLENMRILIFSFQTFVAFMQVATSYSMGWIHVKEKRRIWRVQRMTMFSDVALMNAHSEREFVRRLRVNWLTFDWLCGMMAPFLARPQSNSITLQNRVAISLARLGTGNYLTMCGDLYGMSEGMASLVVREFCDVFERHLKPKLIPRFTRDSLQLISRKFEAKHGIPSNMGAIDCSHIAILAPYHDPFSYYNRKGFHSCHLQVIVDTDTLIWDYDFGVAGSVHDFTVFQQSSEGRKILRGDYLEYKIIGDAAYPCRTWNWVPFKGSAVELPPFKQHWNFSQSSTRMCVERALGVLKGRWRIFLRKIEMPLENVGSIVATCVCLHNLCIMHRDFIDEELHLESRDWLQNCRVNRFGKLLHRGVQKIVDYGLSEVGRCSTDVQAVFSRDSMEQEEAFQESSSGDDEAGLRAGTHMHLDMARNLYREQLERDTIMGIETSDSD